MIFVTVGAQMPFDRLIRVVDEWAETRGRTDVFAQMGPTDFKPSHLKTERFLDPEAFRAQIERATAIVGHAGMGTIISALQNETPLLVMPRLKRYKEHVNDHQLATARKLEELGHILVAYEPDEVMPKLGKLDSFCPKQRVARPRGVAERIAQFFAEL